MTEFVKNRSEAAVNAGLDLGLEQMERMHLFDKTEIKAISKKRKEFEYKIQRRTKCKDDYIRYIHYELDLLKLIRERKDKSGVSLNKADAEHSITHRVDKLFNHVIQRFQSDVRLWTYYIKFCKQVGLIGSASTILGKMVGVHADKPNIWKMAANWEFEECHSIENARKYLLRGLRSHPDSKVLYEEAFRQELVYASMKRKQKSEAAAAAFENEEKPSSSQTTSPGSSMGEEVTDRVLEGRLAEVIYESAKKSVDNVQFYIDLLSIAKEYDFTEKLQNKIVNHLLSEYRNDELSWDTMARRELEGFSYNAHTNNDDPNSTQEKKKITSFKERIRLCSTVYTAVVKQLNTERMWSLYLETLIELNQDLVNLPTFKQNLLKSAFQDAHSAGRLQEKYYLQWVDLLQSTSKFNKLGLVLRQATERFSSNVELWQMRLRFHLARAEGVVGLEVFHNAVAKLGTEDEATLPLWKNLIQYYQATDVEKAQQVFEDGLRLGTAISYALKPLFLEWLLLMKGITAAQKEYDYLSSQPPPCLELHIKMIYIEQMQPDMNLKQMRKCYDAACRQFGKENSDLWMDYAKFEIEHGDPKNADIIYERAKKALDSIQVSIFDSEFNLMRNGMSISSNII